MRASYDVVVVGAGAVGAATALAAAERGARVLVVDRAGVAAGASGAGAGLVCHMSWDPLNVRLVSRSALGFRKLTDAAEARGDDFRYHPIGSTTLVGEPHVKRLEELARLQREAGADVRVIPSESVRDLPRHEHVRVDDIAGAAHCPDDGWASPPAYTRLALALSGADVMVGAAARLEEDRLHVGGRSVEAEGVVLATGVWTGSLLPAAQQAYRTQAARFAGPAAGDNPILHDAVQGFYLRPDGPGRALAGNGTTTTPEDPEAYRKRADDDFGERTLRRMNHRLPNVQVSFSEAWAGVDAATPDRQPLLGPAPGRAGVILATGTNGFGFMRAPALGEAAACLALGERPPVDVSAFSPARFQGRESEAFAIREGFAL